jgi:hypothetical protein
MVTWEQAAEGLTHGVPGLERGDFESVYLGEWKEEEFVRRAPDGDGEMLFRQVAIAGLGDAWGELWDVGGPYMFRCPDCCRLLGHYDVD